MRIVGADERFIKAPFYIEGLLLGLSGGGLGLFFLYFAYLGTVPSFAPEVLFSFFEIRFLPASVCFLILLSSMGIGWAGCHFSIKRFLRI
jgi:cell division transport system permease protein